MKIKQIAKIELEDSEIVALQTIVRIDCDSDNIDCDNCPLICENGECIKDYVKRTLCKNKIPW